MDEDDDDGLVEPTVDTDPAVLESVDILYPVYAREDTVVVSGPLPHGIALSEEDEARRMHRREARKWAKERYGRVLEMIWHPHRWAARILKTQLPGRQ